jgi:hypothetical protein
MRSVLIVAMLTTALCQSTTEDPSQSRQEETTVANDISETLTLSPVLKTKLCSGTGKARPIS